MPALNIGQLKSKLLSSPGANNPNPPTGDSELSDSKQEGAFQKLAGKLAHKKGVDNPDALAAYIGRKSLGDKAYNKRISRGLRKSKKEAVGFSGLASVARGISGRHQVEAEIEQRRYAFIEGSEGSGNFGHAGRPVKSADPLHRVAVCL